MSGLVPVSVRLGATFVTARTITRELRDLTFSATIPGGFETCTFSLDRPLAYATDIKPFHRVFVHDTRHGGLLWEGRLEDPGRGAGRDGQVWTVTAVGGGANLHDRTLPVVYVDRNVERAERNGSSRKSMVTDIDGDGDIRIQANRGDVISTTSFAEVDYFQCFETQQNIARVEFTPDAGVTDSDWRLQVIAEPGGSVVYNQAANTTMSAAAITPPSGTTWLRFRMQRQNTSQTVANDSTWVIFRNLVVVAQRYNANGTVKTSGYTATVTASEIVADVLGRLASQVDGANAAITATSYAIDHLAFYDGIDGAGVVDELLKLHPDHTWAVWEANASGKYRAEFYKLPTTTARFEASAADGYEGPGSAADLYNQATIRWRGRIGQIRYGFQTQAVPVLDDAGLVRQGLVDLSDFSGSTANAAQAGSAFLAQHQFPANAGTLTINRPIFDSALGRMLMPWELVRYGPGQLIRVRDIAPRLDALNATDRDGVTVFRIVRVSWTPDGGAVLDLDSQPRRLTTIIALARRESRRAARR